MNIIRRIKTNMITIKKEDWTRREWKTICKVFNVNPKKCYSLVLHNVNLDIFENEEEEENEY